MPTKKPTPAVWRAVKVVAGTCLLVLGVAGLFLPILQGVLFLFLGLALLATESRRARGVVVALKRRYPGPWKHAEELKARVSKLMHARTDGASKEEASGDKGSSRETP